MEDRESNETSEEVGSGPVKHGGEGDPLGGGVADLDENPRVTEGREDESEVGEPRPPA